MSTSAHSASFARPTPRVAIMAGTPKRRPLCAQLLSVGTSPVDVGRAPAEVFGDIRPATAMVELPRLLDPEMLVEIEASAYLRTGRGR